jgi:hypothetical protein
MCRDLVAPVPQIERVEQPDALAESALGFYPKALVTAWSDLLGWRRTVHTRQVAGSRHEPGRGKLEKLIRWAVRFERAYDAMANEEAQSEPYLSDKSKMTEKQKARASIGALGVNYEDENSSEEFTLSKWEEDCDSESVSRPVLDGIR